MISAAVLISEAQVDRTFICLRASPAAYNGAAQQFRHATAHSWEPPAQAWYLA